MKRRNARGVAERCQLQMTSMIDVVFQLLIFFIVALKQDDICSHLDVVRPEGKKIIDDPIVDLLQVMVHDRGFVLQGIPVNAKELDRKISQIARYSANASVVIKCTKDSSHGLLVQLLDICAKNEMKNLSLFSI